MISPIDGKPFSTDDADRLLGLADQFLEDWEEHEGRGDPECVERRIEYDAIRDLLASAPALYSALKVALEALRNVPQVGEVFDQQHSDTHMQADVMACAALELAAPKKPVPIPTVAESIALAKSQILADMAAGRVPMTIQSFVDLHDYVDANCYGGFCDDDLADALIAHYGGRDEHEGMPDGMLGHINDVQNAIDEWIVANSGQPTKE